MNERQLSFSRAHIAHLISNLTQNFYCRTQTISG
jgi:hypothetical protein